MSCCCWRHITGSIFFPHSPNNLHCDVSGASVVEIRQCESVNSPISWALQHSVICERHCHYLAYWLLGKLNIQCFPYHSKGEAPSSPQLAPSPQKNIWSVREQTCIQTFVIQFFCLIHLRIELYHILFSRNFATPVLLQTAAQSCPLCFHKQGALQALPVVL